jgi:hypothetical protein
MRRSKMMVLWIGLAAILALSCSPLSTAANAVANQVAGSGFNPAGALWSDVPKMDGLNDDPNLDAPTWAKLYVQTVLKAASGGTGSVDWVALSTDKTPDDVATYYTVERMSAQGWDADQQEACFSGSQEGVSDAGTICVFGKTSSNPQSVLAIIAAADDTTTGKTDVFFFRLTEQVTPTP